MTHVQRWFADLCRLNTGFWAWASTRHQHVADTLSACSECWSDFSTSADLHEDLDEAVIETILHRWRLAAKSSGFGDIETNRRVEGSLPADAKECASLANVRVPGEDGEDD